MRVCVCSVESVCLVLCLLVVYWKVFRNLLNFVSAMITGSMSWTTDR